jgi:hypothetical protein
VLRCMSCWVLLCGVVFYLVVSYSVLLCFVVSCRFLSVVLCCVVLFLLRSVLLCFVVL